MPLVSVIMPLYNAASFLEETVQSVIQQTLTDWELIIVDDFSTDSSLSVLAPLIDAEPRIKLIQQAENAGVSVARNKAISNAKGRYIAFLDSDDLWLPYKLEKQIDFMRSNNIAFSYSAYEKVDEAGNCFGRVGVPEKVDYNNLLKTCVIGCLTAIYDTNRLGKVYMPLNTKREDFATWLCILKKVDFAYGYQDVLAQYRVYASQSSGKKAQMAQENWYLYRHIEKLGFIRSTYYFVHYAVKGILRTKCPSLARFLGVLK
ncbi:glycosyltransferase family 2 protein [Pseudoalteromonas sp. T1lg76]|uniref:glycosyltransferase family 2 protein n=1 Tax=Pseudoalteromonas sp. T1lg76 TaxID=2077103 RepID=UPI000CF6F3E4|nr:glycosyltransferase family 2 protein [Pseudoalteromonas sp. T1lg76]